MSAREPFQSLLNDLRETTQTLANCAALGPLQKNGTRTMSRAYVRSTPDDDPEYMTSEEERELQTDEQVERLGAENDRLLGLVADLVDTLMTIAEICGDYGDGAPDDHYLAHLLLDLESKAKDAVAKAVKETAQ